MSTNLVHPTLFYLMNQATPIRTLQKLGRAPCGRRAWPSPSSSIGECSTSCSSLRTGNERRSLVLLADEAFEKVIRPSLYRSASISWKRAAKRATKSFSFREPWNRSSLSSPSTSGLPSSETGSR